MHATQRTELLESEPEGLSRPLSVQAFKAKPTAVVLEEHLSGRLTILDTDTNGTESVTGFHLNAEE